VGIHGANGPKLESQARFAQQRLNGRDTA
jgi:hypothetical protein